LILEITKIPVPREAMGDIEKALGRKDIAFVGLWDDEIIVQTGKDIEEMVEEAYEGDFFEYWADKGQWVGWWGKIEGKRGLARV